MDRMEALLAYRKAYQSTWTDYLYVGYAAYNLSTIDDVIEEELRLK